MDKYKISKKQKIERYIERMLMENKFPGIQYIAFNSKKILFEYNGGYADIKNEKMVDKNTTFNAYSTTKPVTAVMILQLREKKKIKLDDPVSSYLPDIPFQNITIRQLLTHTSGIKNPILGNFYIHWENEHKNYDRDIILKKIIKKNSKLKFPPGKDIFYSNFGYAILGRLIEIVSGLSFEEYIQKNIFNKLKLNKNLVNFTHQGLPNSARPYFKRYSFKYNTLASFIKGGRFEAMGKWKTISRNYYINFPAHGGIVASAHEFSKIFQDLLREKSILITKESKKILFTIHKERNKKKIALSWFMKENSGIPFYFHRGSGIGYVTQVRIYPSKKFGSVLFINESNPKILNIMDELDRDFF